MKFEHRNYATGLEFGLTILVFAGIGWFIDYKAGTLPVFLLVFLFLGFGGALYSMVRMVNADSDDPADKNKKKNYIKYENEKRYIDERDTTKTPNGASDDTDRADGDGS